MHAAAFFLKLNPVSAALNPRPYWLFKDGVICNCAKIPLSELNLEKISKEEPKLLGQWRKNSKKYEVKWLSDTKFKRKIGGAIARPLPKCWRLSGYYESASGKTGLPGFHAGTWEGYYFTMDGTVAAGHGGATSPTTPGYRPKTSKRQGKYDIENFTLTMHFDDGVV